MENQNEVIRNLEKYLAFYPEEKGRLKQFEGFVSKTPEEEALYSRKNFHGHITASSIIVDIENSKILVIKHKTLEKWLQPGGHVDPSDTSILAAAYRECEEEVNIKKTELRIVSPSFEESIPLDIDSHQIPENKDKKERMHYHHDFKYLFIYTGNVDIIINPSDTTAYKWKSFDELQSDTNFERAIKKIRRLLSSDFRTKIYFENIVNKVKWTRLDYKCVVVSHILPGSLVFHQALDKVIPILTIIPKPNSIDQATFDKSQEFHFTHITKDIISHDGNNLVELLNKSEGKLVLFDIGGYFFEIFEKWPEKLLERIELIIEDTENGYQKYEGKTHNKRIVSVARSPLKDNEDFLVGQSVLFSADSLLREQNDLIQYKKCGVFGYGKVGKSIAQHLSQRGITPMVYDIDPIRRIESFNRLSLIPEREKILKTAEVIFCATGNKCMNIEDFRALKDGCYVFSVTSSDDEMELNFLESEYEKIEVHQYIEKYVNDRNNFYLVNKGNAVNFIHRAIMGDFIHLVRSEMILALNELESFDKGKINQISIDLRKEICYIWLKTYNKDSKKLDFVM